MPDVERPDPTMVSDGCGLGGVPTRDLFPQRPASRAAVAYPKPSTLQPLPIRRPSRHWARARRWWRRHWWPARIRDLQAQVDYLSADLWGE